MNLNDQLAALFAPNASVKGGMLASVRATIGSLPMIARAILRRSTKPIRIVVDAYADTGSTDCESFIRLPRLPLPRSEADVETAIDTAALMYGLLHHEVGHINYSDAKDMKNARSGLEATLLNIIEDVRQENVHIGIFPASRRYLDAMNMVMTKQKKWGGNARGLPPVICFHNFMITHLNAVYRLDPVSRQVLQENNTIFDEVFGEKFRLDLEALLTRMATLTSSRDALMLARDVVALLQQQQQASAPQPQQNQQQQPQDQQQSGQQSSSSSNSQASNDEEEDESGDTDGKSSSTNEDGAGEQRGDGEGDEGDAESSTDCDADNSDDQTGASSSSESDDTTGEEQGAKPTSSSGSQGQDGEEGDAGSDDSQSSEGNDTDAPAGNTGDAKGAGNSSSSHQPSTHEAHADAISQVLSNNNAQGTGDKHDAANEILQEIVQAIIRHSASLNLQEALEDLEAASQFSGGNAEREDLNLGADHDLDAGYSASLSIRRLLVSHLDTLTNDDVWIGPRGRRISDRHLAGCIAGDNRVFRNKVEGMSLSTAIMLVQDVSGSMSGLPIKIASQALYASALALEGIDGVDIAAMAFPGNGKVIGFGESPRQNRSNFQLMEWGCTPMAEAISVASTALQEHQLERKLMIVLTDGSPDNGETAKVAIAAAIHAGIEVYGIGIMTTAVEAYFDKSIVINDVNELPNRLVSLIRDQVTMSLAA